MSRDVIQIPTPKSKEVRMIIDPTLGKIAFENWLDNFLDDLDRFEEESRKTSIRIGMQELDDTWRTACKQQLEVLSRELQFGAILNPLTEGNADVVSEMPTRLLELAVDTSKFRKEIRMKNPTYKDVRAIWRAACRQYGVRYVYYKNMHSIKGLGPVVSSTLKVLSAKKSKFFESRYMSVVLGRKKIVITPVKIGVAGHPKRQLEVLAHELQHCTELDLIRYATDKHYRAYIEGKGEAAGADIRRLFRLPIRSSDTVFNTHWREVYRVSTKHAPKAKFAYDRLLTNHKFGKYATQVGADVANISRKYLK